MRIVHLTLGVSEGSVCLHLHRALIESGRDSVIVSMQTNVEDQNVHTIKKTPSRLQKLYNNCEQALFKIVPHKNKIRHSLGLTLNKNSYSDVEEYLTEGDIINIHWVLGGFLSFHDILRLCENYKVVFTHHDAWYFCGLEHHYAENIGIGKDILSKLNQIVLERKLRRSEIYFCSKHIFPSNWLNSDCQSRQVVPVSEVIANCVDSNVFNSTDIRVEDKIVVLVGAVSLNSNPMKGYKFVESLIETSNALYSKEVIFIFYGIKNTDVFNAKFKEKYSNIDFKTYGYISDKKEMAILYAMSDIFLNMSLIENLSTANIEAGLSGCRVISFDVGGNRETVLSKGGLVKPYLVESLIKIFKVHILDRDKVVRRDLRTKIRNNYIEKFNDKKNVESYIRFING